ncbi:hypothetical protein [Pseudofrankia asymbiotica]|uniref:Uncharacterized protein n=1 Tax=Pseudofrankia asymbiotica TaxID=1834516 RepID=A0A1V2IEP9_9ACTN|nr:hypothetical protein [Pseudofrankia asymbiotica]ONH31379.1 hypothetical protein BL253_08900 [Pseudofrankia asymbiotica]
MSGEKPVERDGGRPADRLTGGQVGILLTLMAEDRPVPNSELAARFRLSLDGADRRRLNSLGLVTSRRAGRSYVHELTDAGWARCRREIAAPPAGRSGSIPPGAVHALLAALADHLDRTGLTLADVFRPRPASEGAPTRPDPAGRPGATPAVGMAGSGAGAGEAGPGAGEVGPGAAEAGSGTAEAGSEAGEVGDEVDRRIRTVYGTLARWPGDWVRLADLRPRLGADLARADVDAALRRMNRGPGVTVAPNEDQKALTGADQRDAVEIGGQAKHLIMVEG